MPIQCPLHRPVSLGVSIDHMLLRKPENMRVTIVVLVGPRQFTHPDIVEFNITRTMVKKNQECRN
jgi:hypothetical protein